ncbi:MAG TPA: SRPBCC family protein [Candidatus Limnocylindrales bacterium]|jgi:hypothetical protein
MTWSMQSFHEATVAPEDVFRYYADPATWGGWAHNTAWGRGATPLEAGSTVEVRVRSYPWTYTVRVREVEPGRRLVTEVRPFGVTITSTYDVTATDAGSRLHHTISLAGPFERAYLLVRGQYTRMLEAETRRVAELAAGDASPRASHPQPAAQQA